MRYSHANIRCGTVSRMSSSHPHVAGSAQKAPELPAACAAARLHTRLPLMNSKQFPHLGHSTPRHPLQTLPCSSPQVMGYLKRMVREQSHVVIASIHQPRSAIWLMFDAVRCGGLWWEWGLHEVGWAEVREAGM